MAVAVSEGKWRSALAVGQGDRSGGADAIERRRSGVHRRHGKRAQA
jgi:hypothetical protein